MHLKRIPLPSSSKPKPYFKGGFHSFKGSHLEKKVRFQISVGFNCKQNKLSPQIRLFTQNSQLQQQRKPNTTHDLAYFFVNQKKDKIFVRNQGAPDILRHHKHSSLSRFYDLPRWTPPSGISQGESSLFCFGINTLRQPPLSLIGEIVKQTDQYDFMQHWKANLQIPLGILSEPDFDIEPSSTIFCGLHGVNEASLVGGEWHRPADLWAAWRRADRITSPRTLHFLKMWANHPEIAFPAQPVHNWCWEYAPGFEFIPLKSNTLKPFTYTNLVVFRENQNALIVDPGCNDQGQDGLISILKQLEKTPKIFITHHHHDHWDALPTVEKFFPEAKVYAHPFTLQEIKTRLPTEPICGDGETAQLFVSSEKFLEVLATPGHTPGHLAILDPTSKTLLPGDHVVGYGSAALDPENGSMLQYLDSTKKIQSKEPRIALPAHGPPCYAPVDLLELYVQHRMQREAIIFDAYRQVVGVSQSRSQLLDEIVKIAYQDTPQELWPSAKRNIILHLQKLKEEGSLNDHLF